MQAQRRTTPAQRSPRPCQFSSSDTAKNRFRWRRSWVFAFVGGGVGFLCAFAAALGTACSAGTDDLADYIRRTQPLRNQYAVSADASFDATAAASFSGTYYVSCLNPVLGQNLGNLLRFKATVSYVATDAKSGTLSFNLTPLKLGSVTTGQVVGPVFPPGSPAKTAVTGDKYQISFTESSSLPAATNALNLDLTLTGIQITGYLTNPPAQFCTIQNASAQPGNISAQGTICQYQLVPNDQTPPTQTLTLSAFQTCP